MASATKQEEMTLYSRDTPFSDVSLEVVPPGEEAVWNDYIPHKVPSDVVMTRYIADEPITLDEARLVRQHLLTRGLLIHTKYRVGVLGMVATSSNSILSAFGRITQFLPITLYRDFTAPDLPVATLQRGSTPCGYRGHA